jgi:hypothetical protein
LAPDGALPWSSRGFAIWLVCRLPSLPASNPGISHRIGLSLQWGRASGGCLGQNRSHGWFLPHPLLAFRPAAKPNAGGLPDFRLWPQPDALAVPELTCTAHIKLNRQA